MKKYFIFLLLLIMSCAKQDMDIPIISKNPLNARSVPVECWMVSAQTGTFGTPQFYVGTRHLVVEHRWDTCVMQMTEGEFVSDTFNIFIPGTVPGIALYLDLYVDRVARKYLNVVVADSTGAQDRWFNVARDFKNF